MNTRFATHWRDRLRDPQVHEFLWYCVPAVIVALAIRIWLTISLPYGHYHFDTPDFLQTPQDLLQSGRLTLHFKKTFLTPILYTIPFLLRLPALIVIPLGQHLLGILMVLMGGALCRAWFVFWRWWIVPVTVLLAVQPTFLWFEHTLLAESQYIFGVVWVALAGTWFVQKPNWERLLFLLAALFWTAGARPEGRLFIAFGFLLLALTFFGRWKAEWRKIAIYTLFSVVVMLITRTGQAGVLLYTSLLHLAPAQSIVAPDVSACLAPLRTRVQRERSQRVLNDVVRVEKRVNATLLAEYAPLHPELHLENPKRMSAFCLSLAKEVARAHPWSLPLIVRDRFLARIDDDPGGQFRDYDLQSRLVRALTRGAEHGSVLAKGLAGVPLSTPAQITDFVHAHYNEKNVAWFNAWEECWMSVVSHPALPGVVYSPQTTLPGLPWYYVLGFLGAVVAVVAPSPVRIFHWAFLPVLSGVWFVVTLTGALMPRYRFLLEPFWLLYLFLLVDAFGRAIRSGKNRLADGSAWRIGPQGCR